ncbi:uncharacterized protein [Littorina saxatilis]|uniref:uncharacterized protein n=1 Tax=Littorina saxatilis TaxID=31220 RepID=UPI0038B69C6A
MEAPGSTADDIIWMAVRDSERHLGTKDHAVIIAQVLEALPVLETEDVDELQGRIAELQAQLHNLSADRAVQELVVKNAQCSPVAGAELFASPLPSSDKEKENTDPTHDGSDECDTAASTQPMTSRAQNSGIADEVNTGPTFDASDRRHNDECGTDANDQPMSSPIRNLGSDKENTSFCASDSSTSEYKALLQERSDLSSSFLKEMEAVDKLEKKLAAVSKQNFELKKRNRELMGNIRGHGQYLEKVAQEVERSAACRGLKEELTERLSRIEIIKNTLQGLIMGSGVNWAQDPILLDTVLRCGDPSQWRSSYCCGDPSQ